MSTFRNLSLIGGGGRGGDFSPLTQHLKKYCKQWKILLCRILKMDGKMCLNVSIILQEVTLW